MNNNKKNKKEIQADFEVLNTEALMVLTKENDQSLLVDSLQKSEVVDQFSNKLINKILKDGKKAKASGILKEAKELLKKDYKVDPDLTIFQAIQNLSPTMRILSVKKAAQSLKVPFPLSLDQQYNYGVRILISEVRNRKSKTTIFPKALAKEIWEASQKKGKAASRYKQLSKEAEDNRSNLYLRWYL